jgi:hypothetical protein
VVGVDERWKWWKHCAACGSRIGVYEPVWVEHPDGRMIRSSYLNLDAVTRRRGWRFWHNGCVTREQTTGRDAPGHTDTALLDPERRYDSRARVTMTRERVSAGVL